VIQGYRDKATEDIRNGRSSRIARNRLPAALWRTAARKFDQLHRVLDLEELRTPPGNHLEAPRGDRHGQYAIRINEQYRICFVWGPDGPDELEVVDYH